MALSIKHNNDQKIMKILLGESIDQLKRGRDNFICSQEKRMQLYNKFKIIKQDLIEKIFAIATVLGVGLC